MDTKPWMTIGNTLKVSLNKHFGEAKKHGHHLIKHMWEKHHEGLFSVQGQATVTAEPDEANITVNISTKNMDATISLERNNKTMESVLHLLDDFKIPKKDISTSNFNFGKSYKYENNNNVFDGFITSNTITVCVRDFKDKLGNIMTNLVAVRAKELEGRRRTDPEWSQNTSIDISGLSFSSSKMPEKIREAKKLAIEDAQKKAVLYAKCFGIKTYWLSGFSETGNMPRPHVQYSSVRMAIADSPGGSDVPVSGGSLSYTSTMNTEFGFRVVENDESKVRPGMGQIGNDN